MGKSDRVRMTRKGGLEMEIWPNSVQCWRPLWPELTEDRKSNNDIGRRVVRFRRVGQSRDQPMFPVVFQLSNDFDEHGTRKQRLLAWLQRYIAYQVGT